MSNTILTDEETKLYKSIERSLLGMSIGNCGIKRDFIVWRLAGGWKIGRYVLDRESPILSISSAVRFMMNELKNRPNYGK